MTEEERDGIIACIIRVFCDRFPAVEEVVVGDEQLAEEIYEELVEVFQARIK